MGTIVILKQKVHMITPIVAKKVRNTFVEIYISHNTSVLIMVFHGQYLSIDIYVQ